jgi:hypothetical protein|tara:strand:+ start:52 stop:519 length:468 start_codon:yes stop_codon:yes gene_type:complete
MKYLSIVLSLLLINTSASGAMSPRFYETEILGNWICKDIWPGYSAFEMIRYKKDGTWNSFGELIVDFPIEENKVKVRYSALGTGLWEIENQNLVSMIDYIKVTNRNNPWLDEYFNMEEQFTLNDKKSEKIVVLSDDYINLQPSSGKPYECYKVEI